MLESTVHMPDCIVHG